MRKTEFILISSACLVLASPAALCQTQSSTPGTPQTMADQGQMMVQQGDELIRQGQLMKENGQRLIHQSGVTPSGTAPSSVQTTTTAPANTPAGTTSSPGTSPAQGIQSLEKYQKYIEQGQKILKNPKSVIPGMK